MEYTDHVAELLHLYRETRQPGDMIYKKNTYKNPTKKLKQKQTDHLMYYDTLKL